MSMRVLAATGWLLLLAKTWPVATVTTPAATTPRRRPVARAAAVTKGPTPKRAIAPSVVVACPPSRVDPQPKLACLGLETTAQDG